MKRVCRQKPSTFWSYKFLSVYRIFLSFQTNASIFRSVYRLFTTQWYCGLTYCNPLCHFNFISAWLNTTLAHYLLIYPLLVKVKQAWSGPEGSRKLRFSDFMTTAQDGGKFSRRHRPPLSPENVPGTHFCQRLNRPQAPSAIGRIMSLKIPMTPSGIEPATFRFVAKYLNHCATATPILYWCPVLYVRYDMIYLLTTIGLSSGGSSTVQYSTHLHTNNTQNDTKKQYIEQHNNLGECGPCPVLARFILEFALQLRKKHGKTSARVAAFKNT